MSYLSDVQAAHQQLGALSPSFHTLLLFFGFAGYPLDWYSEYMALQEMNP